MRLLRDGWTLRGTPAGCWTSPTAVDDADWLPAIVPGTVASSLALPLEHDVKLDGLDWWYRCTFEVSALSRLGFDGLATACEAWLDGAPLFRSVNMHRPVVVERVEAGRHELVLCFRALRSLLDGKRPRPRWKTALVADQDLRFIRTTLLGRVPAWTPPWPPVGPYRRVWVDDGPVSGVVLRPSWDGERARLGFRASLPEGSALASAALEVAGQSFPLAVRGAEVVGDVEIPGVEPWFPHTHGAPVLHEVVLVSRGGGDALRTSLGAVGFRAVAFSVSDPVLRVNGVELFARGSCWSAADARAIDGDPRPLLELLRDAGGNVVRVGGTGVYPSDDFLAACDELGILVWQDFMFANMDYPVGDPAFRAEVQAEAEAQLRRLSRHACIAVYCGGSEVSQQVAMLGMPREAWSSALFDELLPAAVAEHHPGVPYVPNSPCGGDLPFAVGSGVAHYFGVGAYRRPLSDVRASRVPFTSECLAFAHVPEDDTAAQAMGGGPAVPHHPRWKAGVPRDANAGWDFEDVRDHYLRDVHGVDPVALRSEDLERYWALSRVVSGEVMHRVFAEWRRAGSPTRGGITWTWSDLRPGAGWGLVDALGRRKPAWWFARRAWAGRAVFLTDEGLDGLDVHVVNEGPGTLRGRLEVTCLRRGRQVVASAEAPVDVEARAVSRLGVSALLGRFVDLTRAYRFGPPAVDAVVVRVLTDDGERVSDDCYFPPGATPPLVEPPVVEASVGDDGLTLRTSSFLRSVRIESPTHLPSDNYFHLAPGLARCVRLHATGDRPARVYLSALNLDGVVTVRA